MGKTTHVTVETTKKFIKVQRLIALGVMFAGMGIMALGMSQPIDKQAERAAIAVFGLVILLIGMGWRLVLRILHWWHHA